MPTIHLMEQVAWSDFTIELATALAPYCRAYNMMVNLDRGLASYDRWTQHYPDGAWSEAFSTADDGVVVFARLQDEVVAQAAIAFYRHDGSLLDFLENRRLVRTDDFPRWRLGNLARDLALELKGSFGYVGGLWVRQDLRGGPVSKGFLKSLLPLLRLATLDLLQPNYLFSFYRDHLVRGSEEQRFGYSKCVDGVVRETFAQRWPCWLAYADPIYVRATARHLLEAFRNPPPLGNGPL